jgi:ATP/maltotriose-dependent transcriptional regulator MalT
MLGSAHVQSGRATRAERILLEAKQAAQSVGYQTVMVLASVYLASVHAQLGDPVRGIEMARSCQAGAKQKGYQSIEVQALLAEAMILSQDSTSVDRAIAQLERAAGMAAQLGMRPLSGIARGALARLLAVSGRKSEAQDELNQAIELFAKSKMTAQLERARLELAKLSN